MDEARYSEWIGRSETRTDIIAPAPLRGLAALFDEAPGAWEEGEIPPLAHWLFFLPNARQSELGEDGHPQRGGFLPPITLPRRMWAGGRLEFHAPLVVGDAIERVSTITGIRSKAGAAGELTFVTILHEIRARGVLAIREEQDVVYRGASSGVALGPVEAKEATSTEEKHPDETSLFRFSALTFNAHRIHYDRPYATSVEGYPDLVVQGPLIASWLLHHWVKRGARARTFSFRGVAPLFVNAPATVCANAEGDVWCRDGSGRTVMSGKVS